MGADGEVGIASQAREWVVWCWMQKERSERLLEKRKPVAAKRELPSLAGSVRVIVMVRVRIKVIFMVMVMVMVMSSSPDGVDGCWRETSSQVECQL